MEKHYEPNKIEEKWYSFWLDHGVFHGDVSDGGDPYCVLIPPPNVTGILHMGHALNNTVQDILVRWHKLQGRNVVWMPGTDHAGIATQNVVERALKAENKTRQDLGRDAFIEKVWQWREKYGNTIVNQLKRLGAACDWERERFTMDEGLSEAVAEVFVQLYNKDLIYKANYIINWCPRCHTALSDEESEHADTKGKLYYIRYKVLGVDSKPCDDIVVATTRPETLLGDVAVAVNPNDERYKDLADKKIILPLLERELKVIFDDFVDPKFGTGIVKVTPAHDPNDFDMGQRHGLTPINVMNGDGTMNSEAGIYEGMDRFDCRKKILSDLDDAGLIEKVEPHEHAVGHCYRCDTVVEPRLSPQWFVKMKPLAGPAIDAINNGDIEFVPGRWKKVYLGWMENIRDWCISRQIWWGHRIPVFYCDDCGAQWAAKGQPEECPKCSSKKIRQDEDVLDTWFSSWLWPFSTFGWPKSTDDLSFYLPTNDLVTASEIIFFWVARMVMASIEFTGKIPFNKVYIHGTVRDDKGRKMSKSLGNSIDPITIIDQFSADALRFSLIMITATGQDVYLSNDKFEIGRNFGTKLWNAARFMQMHIEKIGPVDSGNDFNSDLLSKDDKHILASLNDAIRGCDTALSQYRFNDAAHVLYDFVWHKYCDWYVECSKDVLYGDDLERKKQLIMVMNHVFSSALKLLHPIMPFITEELWHEMGYATGSEKVDRDGRSYTTIMNAPWPVLANSKALEDWAITDTDVVYVNRKQELVKVGRNLKSDYGISPAKKVNYIIKPVNDVDMANLLEDCVPLQGVLRAEALTIEHPDFEPDHVMPSGLSELGTIYMPLEGVIDVDSERDRLTDQFDKVRKDFERVSAKLDNRAFVEKAPENVVNRQKQIKSDLLEKSEKMQSLITTLTEMGSNSK